MKTIIDLAREANLPACHLTHPEALQRFADLLIQRELQPLPSSLPLTLGQLQPGQRFTLLRTGKQYQVIRHERHTYSGLLRVVVRYDPYITSTDGHTEYALHHSCHVLLETT